MDRLILASFFGYNSQEANETEFGFGVKGEKVTWGGVTCGGDSNLYIMSSFRDCISTLDVIYLISLLEVISPREEEGIKGG